MDERIILVGLVLVMFFGSYLSGLLPLSMTFSEDKLKKFTAFGAGLLVGTALCVIIPEGVRSLIPENASHSTDQTQATGDPLSSIGYCLVLGFIFMLIVDQMSQKRNSTLNPSERNVTATIGLVVHAAADGVALGAAATTSHADVELIVFLAIMLHKAPAAFGLVTFLLHEGIERPRIKRHLLVFSLAAPFLTVFTYVCIGQKGKETLHSFNATGIAMLFSAGTFLYVATVHVLADLTQNAHQSYSRVQSLEGGPKPPPSSGLKFVELLSLIVGCLTPLVLTVGHHH